MGNLTRITKFKYLALLIMYSFTDCFGQSFPRNDGKIVASLRGTKQSLYLLNNTKNGKTEIFQKIFCDIINKLLILQTSIFYTKDLQ